METFIGTIMPGESFSVEFPSGKVAKLDHRESKEGIVVPLCIPDWSGDTICISCKTAVFNAKYFAAGERDNQGNFPQWARMERECYNCGHCWLEATLSGTERRRLILEGMPPILFKIGDKVVYKKQKYAEDRNTKTHIESIAGCVVQDTPFLSQEFFSNSDGYSWRYPVKVPGYNHDLTLAQEGLEIEV